MDTKNWGIEKEMPVTKSAGQTCIIPARPAKAQISQNGIIKEKIGNCLPTIAEIAMTSYPWTVASVMIGVPNAPKATGAVFAIKDNTDAASGENPSPIKIAAVTATGVPKPAAPSKKAPNANAIKSSCKRRSSVILAIEFCNILKEPFFSVSCCKKMTFKTIQPIGNTPINPPNNEALIAISPGMPKTIIAISIALNKARPAAMWALRCKIPRLINMTTIGIEAIKVDSQIFPKGL